MQHVVQIAFDFDDERVKKILEETTVDEIQKDIGFVCPFVHVSGRFRTAEIGRRGYRLCQPS